VDGREQPLVPVPSRTPTLRFGPSNSGYSHEIYGSGSCNSYSSGYTLSGDTIHIDASVIIGLSQLVCLPAAIMDQENAYFRALPRVERYRLAGNTLTLTSADGSVELVFRAGVCCNH
jgi:heat shock protein HslJ